MRSDEVSKFYTLINTALTKAIEYDEDVRFAVEIPYEAVSLNDSDSIDYGEHALRIKVDMEWINYEDYYLEEDQDEEHKD